MAQGESISDVLRRAVSASGLSHNALAKATGIQRASIDRFIAGTQSLRLDKADVLATFFKLELRPQRKGR
jgi:plasmid maintenance system antidote protein VapI